VTAAQSCLVSPFWVDLGWVRWHGTPAAEKLYTIEYRRCPEPAAEPLRKWGSLFSWCAAHRAERVTPFTSKGDPK
jgi:hypothetical protein